MIARIKTDNGFYNSIVFAIFNDGWKSEVLVFNQDYTALQTVHIYTTKIKIHRNVFIYDTEKDAEWISKKKVEGYNWILKNVTKGFFKTKINDTSILDKCKALQATVEDCCWFELKNETDIDGLMYVAFGFHDSYVKDMYIESGKQFIHFDTTWGCEILFELDGNFETNLFKDYGHIAIGDDYPLIMDSSMFFENNLIYWVDCDGIQNTSAFEEYDFKYFCANRIKWKLII